MDPSGASGSGQVTRLLSECATGDEEAFDELIPLVYEDLRRIAHRRLQQQWSGHTLNTTEVVHEAYLKLVNQATATWKDRTHFFAVAATVIRHVLIDYARGREAVKRGGGLIRIPLSEEMDGENPDNAIDLLALEDALDTLGQRAPRLVQVVECRFFGGMTMRDTAEALGISLRTAERDWTRARTYLYRALAPE